MRTGEDYGVVAAGVVLAAAGALLVLVLPASLDEADVLVLLSLAAVSAFFASAAVSAGLFDGVAFL